MSAEGEEEAFDHPDAALPLTIVASYRQKGNPMLPFLKEFRTTFANVVPDYLLSPTTSTLFISLKYHRLHPDYLETRITSLKKQYRVRLLLCLVDLPDFESSLESVTLLAFRGSLSLFLAWSTPEAARILRTFKQIGDKPPDIIQSKLTSDLSQRAIEVLTTLSTINKVDAVTLMKELGSMKKVLLAKEDILNCPGIGERKLAQVMKAFHEPIYRPSVR